jgi:hypothetical protein
VPALRENFNPMRINAKLLLFERLNGGNKG